MIMLILYGLFFAFFTLDCTKANFLNNLDIYRTITLIVILLLGLTRILTSHPVTWSKRDSFCRDQYLDAQPEELPSVPVRSILRQTAPPRLADGFSKFNFDKEDDGDA